MDYMDLRALFETLVTNDFIPDFPYYRRCFTFKTLFYDSTFAYQMCSCGYQHENLAYITPSGDMDKDMYGKILKCITDGKCEHVDGQPEDHVAETKIYGIHVAAAVGTMRAFESYDVDTDKRAMEPVGLFGVHLCGIAITKNQHEILGLLLKKMLQLPFKNQYLLCSQRLDENGYVIRFHYLHLLRLCIAQNSRELLTMFLQSWQEPPYLKQALEFTFKHSLSCMETILSEHIKGMVLKGCYFYIGSCAEAAVIFNRPETLYQILTWSPTHVSDDDLRHILETSRRLRRHECVSILKRFRQFDEKHIADEEDFGQLIIYLDDHFDALRDEIITILETKVHDVIPILKAKPHLLADLDANYNNRYFRPEFHSFEDRTRNRRCTLTTLFELGADITKLKCSPLRSILEHDFHEIYVIAYRAVRGAIELVLSENPVIEHMLHLQGTRTNLRDILESSVKVDSFIYCQNQNRPYRFTRCRPGDYAPFIMDSGLHTHSGHSDYAFHFVLPLLLECGMNFTRESLVRALQEELHPLEREYLLRYISEARSLQKRCRDALRRRFTGRQIHTYLAMENVPTSIRNFILLKDMLLMI